MTKKRRKARPPRKRQPIRQPDRASNPTVHWIHGLAAMGDERWNEAIASMERFLDLVPEGPERRQGYQNLAACYLAIERYDDALVALDQASRRGPRNPDIARSRAVILACAGRIADAIAEFEHVAGRWPAVARKYETRDTLQYLRRIQDGKVPAGSYLVDHLQVQVSDNMNLGDWHLVERKGRRMIAADPQRPEGHFALGVACVKQECHPEALEAFLAAHALDPNYVPTMSNIGLVHVQLGQPEQLGCRAGRAADV